QLGGGADAHNPQRTELALLEPAPGVRELQPALHRLFGGTVQLGFSQEIAAGALQYLFALGAAFGSAFDTRHGVLLFFGDPCRIAIQRLEARRKSEASSLALVLCGAAALGRGSCSCGANAAGQASAPVPTQTNHWYGIMRLILGASAGSTSTAWRSFRFRFLSFEVRMWRRCECPRCTLPPAVFLKRLEAPL